VNHEVKYFAKKTKPIKILYKDAFFLISVGVIPVCL
jgi:hypothetical protein